MTVRTLLSFVLACAVWATPQIGVAHTRIQVQGGQRRANPQAEMNRQLPVPVTIRSDRHTGLIVDAWINNAGPYSFAVDTGAGTTLIAGHVASAAKIVPGRGRRTTVSGITGAATIDGSPASVRTLALGDARNVVSSNQKVIISDRLPPNIDGVLDPTETFWPLGYSIDIPGRRIEAFNPLRNQVTMSEQPLGGAVVRWITDNESRRPFVRLGDGRLALIDTGSSFGLAISNSTAASQNNGVRSEIRDISGGSISSKRTQPSTVTIGSLTLHGVPTDLLFGTDRDAPILLGREVLYPMKLIFDPVHRLISIQPVS